jgi:hypothetical protein
MDCPFCEQLATALPNTGGYDGDIIECPKYGRVKIAGSMLGKLKALDLHSRVAALFDAMKKVRPGEVPEITGIEV